MVTGSQRTTADAAKFQRHAAELYAIARMCRDAGEVAMACVAQRAAEVHARMSRMLARREP